jgi:hypothetical protein
MAGWHNFSINEGPVVDSRTGRFRERDKVSRMDRRCYGYILRSLERLGMYGDCPAPRTKKEACKLLQTYGYLLPKQQQETLAEWCSK